VNVTDPNSPETIYEDAEDEATTGWSIVDNDPSGALISNVYDDDTASRVIEFLGGGLDNAYRLSHENADHTFGYWNDRAHTVLSWDMRYAEPYKIYIKTTTLAGPIRLEYAGTPSDDAWHHFEKDISVDIKANEPDNQLIAINYFQIRGSGKIDNIIASGEHSYPPLNRTGYIKRSSEDAAALGDLEAIRYVTPDNEFAIVDDDKHLIYGLDLDTNRTSWIIDDSDFGTYTQDHPNGYDPLNSTCQYKDGQFVGFCDPEAIAYDPGDPATGKKETLYVFTGNHPGELTTFKLSRTSTDQDFTISDWRRMSKEHSSAIVIGEQLYVSLINPATGEGEIVTYDWENDTTGSALFTTGYEIEDMAYDASSGKLWILTAPDMLYRLDWSTKSIEEAYDMQAYDIMDPRGVEVVGDTLYIGDGDDTRTDDLKHAVHVFDLP
jgi:hypothetical protein